MATLADVATRHMAAGIEDLEELARLCELETGKPPGRHSLMSYRSKFRRDGANWLAKRDAEATREASRKYHERNRDAAREKSREWHRRRRESDPEGARETSRRWYEANKEKSKAISDRWRAKNVARALLSQARGRAGRRGMECSITEPDVEAMLAPGVCALTGLPFVMEWDGPSRRNPWTPSLDRIDVTKGYIDGNVRAVCWIVNHIRCDYPDEVVAIAAKAMAEALGA